MKKILLGVFPAGLALAVFFWYLDSQAAPAGSLFDDRVGMVLAFGRLAGIVGAAGVMWQMLLMSRAAWLEPLFGANLPVRIHHIAGLIIPLALLVHPPLVVWHHAMQTGNGFLAQYLAVLKWEDVLAAACGEFLIITAVVLSLPFARKRLSYKAWHTAHLGAYLGLALSIGHQLELGGDIAAEMRYFARIWYFMLGFTAVNILWYRLIKPRWPVPAASPKPPAV